MTIPGLNTQEVHDIITRSSQDMKDLKNEINNVGESLAHLSNIRNIQVEYSNMLLDRMQANPETKTNDYVLTNEKHNVIGNYEKFGTTIYRRTIRERNVFNIRSASGYFYRTDISSKIGNHRDEQYEEFLKHESIQKRPTFVRLSEKFFEGSVMGEEPEFIVEPFVDTEIQAGSTYFNTIQIHPHLPGSFNIVKIRVLENESDGWITINDDIIDGTSKRIILDRKYALLAVELHIKMKKSMKLEGQDSWYFGLKHLYFFDTDYQENSDIIFEVEQPEFIHSIHEKITIQTPFERKETTLREMEAEVFAGLENGQVEHRIMTSNDYETNTILRNIKKFYVKMPVPKEGITSIYFHNIQLR